MMKKDESFSIFIADDIKINRLLLESQLKAHYKNITMAKDGKEAHDYLQKNKYDLILLDLQMPYYSGLDLIKIIKQKDSINIDSPTIAITAHAQNHQKKMLINAGFDECLIKPILLEELTEILNLWLPESQSPHRLSQSGNGYISMLLERTAGNKELATTIFYKLFTELPQQTQIIENALMYNDLHLAMQITHKLHGSVSFCGFTNIQSKANDLENSLIKKNHDSIRPDFLALESTIVDLINSKTTILNELLR